MTDSFVFYASFYTSISKLNDADQLTVYQAVCGYALTGEEPALDGVPSAIFDLIKPQLDANRRRRENGSKGGRPKAEQKQTKTETKPKHNLERTESKANVNGNVNVNVNNIYNDQSAKPIAIEFEQLWSIYPRKEGRKMAHKAYERARKNNTTFEEVKAGIERYNEHIKRNKTQRQYIMQGSTFFNGERWQDEWKDEQKKPTSFSNFTGRDYGEVDNRFLNLIQL